MHRGLYKGHELSFCANLFVIYFSLFLFLQNSSSELPSASSFNRVFCVADFLLVLLLLYRKAGPLCWPPCVAVSAGVVLKGDLVFGGKRTASSQKSAALDVT